jgi:hypothetical protein
MYKNLLSRQAGQRERIPWERERAASIGPFQEGHGACPLGPMTRHGARFRSAMGGPPC